MDEAVSEMMEAFTVWAENNEGARAVNFQSYVHSIAQARYVVRRVLRIVDDQAKHFGLDPLQHQALLQIYGASEDGLPVNRVAERLDIAPAFASRLTKELESKGLVRRSQSSDDRRVTTVTTTEDGVEVLRRIDDAVHLHVEYFQKQLGNHDRMAALAIFAFYVGMAADSHVARAIRDDVREAQDGQRAGSGPRPPR